MRKVDVLIIGGGPAGLVTALTGKNYYPSKEFLIVRREKEVLIPCAIPYLFYLLERFEDNVISDSILKKNDIDYLIDTVSRIDLQARIAETEGGETIKFDRLVFATGSRPKVPRWLKGADLDGVYTIKKDRPSLEELKARVREAEHVVVVGAGFIGVEVTDDLVRMGKKVTLVEKLPGVLPLAFDEEFSREAERLLRSLGVNVITGRGIKEVYGPGHVEGVILEDGTRVEADLVVLAMGYRPNVELARDAGVKIGESGAIAVDAYMRTNVPGVFAVGDCAEKKHFLTGKPMALMLASIAVSEARIAGMNLYELKGRPHLGVIGIFSTVVCGVGFGTAGITERFAKEEGLQVVTGMFETVDKHPGKLPDAHKLRVKLIADRETGIIVGGQVMGGPSAGELVNLIGFAIQGRLTVQEVFSLQVGTHPLLTSSPIVYPIIRAADIVKRKMHPR